MVYLLRLAAINGQTNYKFNRLRQGNSKHAKGPLKVLATQRQKLIKEGQQNRRYDKKLNQIKLLNYNLKNSGDSIELFQLVQKNQKIMDAINVSTSAIAAARLVSSKNIDNIELKNIQATYTLLNQLILQYVHKMNERSVTNCLWSLGKAIDIFGIEKKQDYHHVFVKLCERAMIISNKMNTQNASNSLWAMAKFQWKDDNLIQKIVKKAISLSKKQILRQELCNILWAMAILKYNNIKDIQHFVELSKTSLQEMNGQDVANLIWAIQQLRYYDKELILMVEDNIMNNKGIVFNPQDISNITIAFTDLGLQNNKYIFEILVQQFISNKVIKLQQWTNFLYALAVLDCPLNLSQQVVDKLLVDQNQNNKLQDFIDIQLIQIQLAQVYYNIRGQKLNFPSDLEQKCKAKHQDQMRRETLIQNSFLDEVFPIIKSHFDHAQKRILIYDDQIDTDITLQNGGLKVAIMVNTPQSYFVNFPENLLGRCQHRAVLLEQLNWKVVEVSGYKWYNNPQYQQQILDNLKAKFI